MTGTANIARAARISAQQRENDAAASHPLTIHRAQHGVPSQGGIARLRRLVPAAARIGLASQAALQTPTTHGDHVATRQVGQVRVVNVRVLLGSVVRVVVDVRGVVILMLDSRCVERGG